MNVPDTHPSPMTEFSHSAQATGTHAGEDAGHPIVVAVDAMGADFRPTLAVQACAMALKQNVDLNLRLFGDAEVLRTAIAALEPDLQCRIQLVPSPDFIAMDSSPAQALRKQQQSSMAMALDSLNVGPVTVDDAEADRKSAQAVVSSGNTGALMALARSRLGMLPGVERPALMTAFPVRGGKSWVLDLGANIGVDADRLVEFAVLGSAAVSALISRAPKVGLLNIGAESNKGPDFVREAARALQQTDLDYIGFVEGHDVFAGAADVIVCDGFAGNVLLKSAEGAIGMLLDELQSMRKHWLRRWLFGKNLDRLQQRYNPAVHNGASLLGINGIVIKSHAHADVHALARAIALAVFEVQRGMLPELERQLWAGG